MYYHLLQEVTTYLLIICLLLGLILAILIYIHQSIRELIKATKEQTRCIQGTNYEDEDFDVEND